MTVVSDRSAMQLEGGRTLSSGRRALFAFLAVFVATLGTALLGLAFTDHGLVVLWPAAGLITGIWLIAPRDLRPAVIAGIALGLCTGGLLVGRHWSIHVLSIVGNIGEAWLVGALLERWVERPFRLETLQQVGYFIAAIGISVSLGGMVGSFALLYTPVGGDYGFGKIWWTWISARGIGMLTVAPAVIALGTMSRRSLDLAWRYGKGSLGVLVGVTVLAYMIVSVELPHSDVLALLALLVVVYPFILWIAARNEPAWTYISLLLLTLVVVWRLGHGGGLMRRNVEVGQAFLLVSSLWSLTLAVVWEQQRRAMASAQNSERSMRHALAAGRGFTFEYDPRSD